jgi:hypothetical protein
MSKIGFIVQMDQRKNAAMVITYGGLKASYIEKMVLHFSELGATYIRYLEKALLSMQDEFVEEVTVTDTNRYYRNQFPSWQYTGADAWHIRKEEFLKSIQHA